MISVGRKGLLPAAAGLLAVAGLALLLFYSQSLEAQTQPQGDDERKFVLVESHREVSCGITEDDVLRCWGNNYLAPVRAEGFKDVGVGDRKACGLRTDGTVQCWTYTSGTTWVYPLPVKEDGSAYTFSDLSSGPTAFCGLQDGRNGQTPGIARCWGQSGKLNSDVPDNLATTVFAQVDIGLDSACGLVKSGTDADKVKCWGPSNDRIVRNFTSDGIADLTFSSLTVGENHACGLIKNEGQNDHGDLKCWGSNSSGQLASIPAGTTFSSVSAGNGHTCGILDGRGSQTAGQVKCWGAEHSTTNSGQQTVPASLASATFKLIYSGYDATCGILDGQGNQTEDAVKCWGGVFPESSPSNQFHRGNAVPWEDRSGLPVLKTNHDANTLSSGTHGFCVLTDTGDVVCNGHSFYPYEPITGVKAVSAGPNAVCTVKSGGADDGKVQCKGLNQSNVATPPTDATFSDLSATLHWLHNCGILDGQGSQTAGRVRCWGWDTYNQSTLPSGLQNATFSAVGAGYLHTCGILDDSNGDQSGQMRCWGDPPGQANVGQADVPKNTEFTHLGPGFEYDYTFESLGMGFFHSCGILDDGLGNPQYQVRCWGWDAYGQSSGPKEKIEQSGFRQVSAGRYHTCAITTDGFPRCWGNLAGTGADYGQVDIPDEYRYAQFDSITASWWATCGVTREGRMACWGADTEPGTEGIQLWIAAKDNANDEINPNGEANEVIPNWFLLQNIGGFDPQPPAPHVAWPPTDVAISRNGTVTWSKSPVAVDGQQYAVRWAGAQDMPEEEDLPSAPGDVGSASESSVARASQGQDAPMHRGIEMAVESTHCSSAGVCRFRIPNFNPRHNYLLQAQTQEGAPHMLWATAQYLPGNENPPPPAGLSTPTPAPTPTPTPQPRSTPGPSPTPTATAVPPGADPPPDPAATPTATPLPAATATPTPTPSRPVNVPPSPAATHTPTPTAPVLATATPAPTRQLQEPAPTPSSGGRATPATATPTPLPVAAPAATATATPTPHPVTRVKPEPTATPPAQPAAALAPAPSPTPEPTRVPVWVGLPLTTVTSPTTSTPRPTPEPTPEVRATPTPVPTPPPDVGPPPEQDDGRSLLSVWPWWLLLLALIALLFFLIRRRRKRGSGGDRRGLFRR